MDHLTKQPWRRMNSVLEECTMQRTDEGFNLSEKDIITLLFLN